MATLIPTSGTDRQQDLEVTIDTVSFIVRFQWVQRLGRWCVDFLQADETPIIAGRVVRPNFPLTDRFVGDALPDGSFVVIRRDGGSEPFGLGELATEGLFFFVPSAELEANRPVVSDDFGTLTFTEVP